MSTWAHRDTRGLAGAATLATARALAGRWDASAQSVADLRALALATAYARAQIIGPAPLDGSEPLRITMRDADPGTERGRVARMLDRTFEILVRGARLDSAPLESFATADGGPPTDPRTITTSENVAALPLLAVAAIVTGGAIAFYFVVEKAAPVVDRYLARSQAGARMATTQASAVAVLASHAELEKIAGKELPLTEAERATFAALASAQETAAKEIASAAPAATLPTLGALELASGFSFGALAAFGLGAWFLLRKG